MTSPDLQRQVMMAARDQGISSVLFRNAIGHKLGLSITEYEALSYITITGVATPTELARYTSMTTGAATTMLDRLEKMGFITRKPNPNDRRGVLVEVNKVYQEKAQPLVAGIQQAHRELMSMYSDEQLEVIAGFLNGFTKNVIEATEKIEQK